MPEVASHLVAQGHAVSVLTLTDPGAVDPASDQVRYSFPVVRIPRWSGWKRLLRIPLTIFSIVRHGRGADLLYVNGLALESCLARRLIRKPMVMKVVGDLAWERARTQGLTQLNLDEFQRVASDSPGASQAAVSPTLPTLPGKVRRTAALRSWWTRQADLVIVPSRYLGRIVAGWGLDPGKIEVVYNGVAAPEDLTGSAAELPASFAGRKLLVTVGRLVAWKHVDRLIEAVAELDEVALVVVGDGPLKQQLQTLAESAGGGVGERVHFAGQVTQQEAMGWMKRADLVVLNSTYEGLPHVIVEACLLGKAVAATDAGGTFEVLEDYPGATRLEPGDSVGGLVGQLKEALLGLPSAREEDAQSSPQSHAFSRKTLFSRESMLSRTTELLVAALEGSPVARSRAPEQ